MDGEKNNICREHSGCLADIVNLKRNNTAQWEKLDAMDSRINSIFTRINIILGGVAIACIMLAINLIIK